VVKRIGHVAYKLALPPYLAKIYDLFHVSLLRKADINPSRVLPQVSWEVKKDLTMDVKPIRILDQSEKELRNKKIPMVKVIWKSPQVEDTWERALEMKVNTKNYSRKQVWEFKISRMNFS
jgi:hypothetical protein